MSAIFEEMDRLAAERYAEAQGETETTVDMHPCSQLADEPGQQLVEELLGTIPAEVGQHRESFNADVVLGYTNCRYDLIPAPIVMGMLHNYPKAYKFVTGLFRYVRGEQDPEWLDLADLLGVPCLDLMHLYGQALHDIAIKYGECNWERTLTESELLNHALYHLFKLVVGDSTENHQALLVCYVMTLVYQRATETYREVQRLRNPFRRDKGDQ